jgi:hypothetical protein
MAGHCAEEIVTQVDWEEWPDFELFAGDDDRDDASETDEAS